jgi:hypothetical protein
LESIYHENHEVQEGLYKVFFCVLRDLCGYILFWVPAVQDAHPNSKTRRLYQSFICLLDIDPVYIIEAISQALVERPVLLPVSPPQAD